MPLSARRGLLRYMRRIAGISRCGNKGWHVSGCIIERDRGDSTRHCVGFLYLDRFHARDTRQGRLDDGGAESAGGVVNVQHDRLLASYGGER